MDENEQLCQLEVIQSEKSKWYWSNVISVMTMPIEGIFFFGVIMGWPNLAEIYKDLGVYEHVCDLSSNTTNVMNATVNCPQRDLIFTTAGTLGSVAMNMATLPLGYIFDKYGTFWARSLCTSFMSVGLLLLAFTQEANFLMFPGIILLSAGGFSLLVTNHALSVFFPVVAAFILVFGQGVFQCSGVVFRLWSYLLNVHEMKFKYIVYGNIMFTLVMWLRTLFLMPVGWTKKGESVYKLSPFCNRWPTLNGMKRDLKKTANSENDSFKTSATSAGFVLLVIWIGFENLNILFCTFTWSQYSRLVDELSYKHLVDTFGEFLWTAAIFSTFVGVVIDLISSFLSKRGFTLSNGRVIGTLVFVFLDNFVGLMMGYLQLQATSESSFSLVIIYNLYRAWCYSTATVYIKANFPIEYFGRMMGIMRVSMGISSLLVLLLTEIPNQFPENGFTTLFISFMVLQLLGFVFPLHGFVTKFRTRSKSQ